MRGVKVNNQSPMLWQRGAAVLADDVIGLAQQGQETYALAANMSWLRATGTVSSAISIEVPSAQPLLFALGALQFPLQELELSRFVRDHGLLESGVSSTTASEKIVDWEQAVTECRDLLLQIHEYQQSIKPVAPVLRKPGRPSRDASNLTGEVQANPEAARQICDELNRGMGNVAPRLITIGHLADYWPRPSRHAVWRSEDIPLGKDSATTTTPGRSALGPSYSPAGHLIWDAQVSNLISYAYFQAAMIFERQLPLARCAGCPHFFISRDQRAEFCSSACRNRARAKRQYARKKGGAVMP